MVCGVRRAAGDVGLAQRGSVRAITHVARPTPHACTPAVRALESQPVRYLRDAPLVETHTKEPAMNIFRALGAFATPRRLLIVASAAVAVFVFASGGRADASAMLTALPADVVIPAGQSSGTTMLTWNTFSAQGAQIYVSVDGAPEVPQIVNASAVG